MLKTAIIARKELVSFWATPVTLRVLAVFLAATCVAVLGVARFFDRGVADVRPLFQWLPPALGVLTAALTMRQWSEERRAGTLQLLLALPLPLWQAVLGKFLAAMAVLLVALGLTLPLPAVAALFGPLEWGPVLGGYAACLLLAAAYTALGLWLSALTDEPLAAFLAAALAGGLLYFLGTPPVLDRAVPACRGVLAGMGTASRFASAERGLLDLRDLVYFASLCMLFLLLAAQSLEHKRWGAGLAAVGRRRGLALRLALAIGGLLALNLLLGPLHSLRFDLRSRAAGAGPLAALGEAQENSCVVFVCALMVAGLVGVGAAARAWRKRERPLELIERDAYIEGGLIK
jgi:ABC-2 type transport system permease protein